jgi:hypothetical protein
MEVEKQVHTATCWSQNNQQAGELCFDGVVSGERVKRSTGGAPTRCPTGTLEYLTML